MLFAESKCCVRIQIAPFLTVEYVILRMKSQSLAAPDIKFGRVGGPVGNGCTFHRREKELEQGRPIL
jgi:hypothetical protein